MKFKVNYDLVTECSDSKETTTSEQKEFEFNNSTPLNEVIIKAMIESNYEHRNQGGDKLIAVKIIKAQKL